MRSNLPPKEKFLGKTIKGIPDYVIREYVASGSNGHLYRAVNEQTNNEWALKIVPISNVISKDERDEYLEEARKANALENRSVVRYHRVVKHSDAESEYVVFACDYVKGQSLRDYVRKNASEIDVPFVENFLRTMFGLLYELERRQYQHGDFTPGTCSWRNRNSIWMEEETFESRTSASDGSAGTRRMRQTTLQFRKFSTSC